MSAEILQWKKPPYVKRWGPYKTTPEQIAEQRLQSRRKTCANARLHILFDPPEKRGRYFRTDLADKAAAHILTNLQVGLPWDAGLRINE